MPSASPPPPSHPPLRSSPVLRRALASWLWGAAVGAPTAFPLPADEAAWADLPALAEGHGLAALVLAAAEKLAADAANAPPGRAAAVDLGLAALRDAAARTLGRGARMLQDLRRAHAALVDDGLRPLWLKGAHLADEAVYQPPEARPLAALALYLDPAGQAAAEACLTRLGYRPGLRSWKHHLWRNPGCRVVDLRGEHADNPRPIELHFWLGEDFRGIRLGMDPAWAARESGAGGSRLKPEAAMAHLAAHTTVNLLERRLRLVQLLDLLRLGAGLDAAAWRGLEAFSVQPGNARFLWPSLALLERIRPGAVPGATLDALEQRCNPTLRLWLREQPLDSLTWQGRALARRAFLELPRLWPLDWRERSRYWQVVLLPGPARLADRYPELAQRGRPDLMLLAHLGYSLRLIRRRWRQRG